MSNSNALTLLADQLSMFAVQIADAAAGHGEPVNPWHIDDWLASYRRELDKDS